MPYPPAPVGNNGPINPFWNAIFQKMHSQGQGLAAVTQGAQQTITVDHYGNAIVILGQVNQTVTIGATHGQAGVQVGTGLPAGGAPNASLVVQRGLVTTTITTTEGNSSATVDSAVGMVAGMVIGAADVSDPSSGIATPAITPGTTIAGVSGTTITLSQDAAESGTAIACAACFWTSLASGPATSYWIAPSLINSWANVAGWGAGYLRDPFGVVHLRGRVNGGANNSVAFVLPAGYRPGEPLLCGVAGLNVATPVAAAAAVDTAGNVSLFYTSAVDIGLGAISFLAEN
jgi:hypothetical protein